MGEDTKILEIKEKKWISQEHYVKREWYLIL